MRRLIDEIARERKRRGMTVREAAEKMAVSREYWYQVENGPKTVATLATLRRMARAVGLVLEVSLRPRKRRKGA